MCMYLSEGKSYNFDKITAVSYFEAFVRSGCYSSFLICQLETQHRYYGHTKICPVFEQKKKKKKKTVPERKNEKNKASPKFYEVWME